jgi:WD40 repeat protein
VKADFWSGRELVQWTKAGQKRWRARIEGTALVTEAISGSRKPRESRKKLGSKAAAREELDRAVRKKMLEGYAYFRGRAGAAHGDRLFAMRPPGGFGSSTFDVDPEGRFVFVGAGRGDPKAWVVRVDLGAERLDQISVAPDRPGGQLFIHAAAIDADGRTGYYALNARTRELDFATGKERVAAGFGGSSASHFNTFCVKPGTDAAHRRMLVLCPKDVLEVREIPAGRTLCAVSLRSPTAECRSAALSPSGRLLAAYMASRYLVYQHEDARRDKTNEVRVFNVDDGSLIARVPMPEQVDEVGVTPDDGAVVVSLDSNRGPCAFEVEDGKLRFAVRGEESSYGHCSAWAFSPDGSTLAVGDHTREVRLLDARSLAPRGVLSTGTGFSGVERLAFTAGGTELFVGGGGLIEAFAIDLT